MESTISFDNKCLAIVDVFGIEIWITETILNTWIIMGVIIILALILRFIFFRNFKDVPTGAQNAIEAVIELYENFATSTIGKNNTGLNAWFFTAFVFILFSNLSGLFTLRSPTADIAATGALSIMTFFIIQIQTMRKSFKGYCKSMLEPFPVFLPMNIIGEIATPVSLAFRLFGNLMGGLIIMGLIYSLLPTAATIGIPALFHFYFDLFAGCLQAYIFVMLSMSFINNKTADAD